MSAQEIERITVAIFSVGSSPRFPGTGLFHGIKHCTLPEPPAVVVVVAVIHLDVTVVIVAVVGVIINNVPSLVK